MRWRDEEDSHSNDDDDVREIDKAIRVSSNVDNLDLFFHFRRPRPLPPRRPPLLRRGDAHRHALRFDPSPRSGSRRRGRRDLLTGIVVDRWLLSLRPFFFRDTRDPRGSH